MKGFLHHLFLPHESNNHRAKLLHHHILLFTIICLFLSSLTFPLLKSTFPSVLGISSNVSSEELLQLTNKVRQEQGLPPLAMNSRLAIAAENKAEDMFAKDYWAHNAPDGRTPWVFIKGAGYNYVYAGENLARGFQNNQDVIDAWIASPTHRANVLSENYTEVGFAVKKGELSGEETVLIVEELGNQSPTFAQALPSVNKALLASVAQNIEQKPLINSAVFSLNLNTVLLSFFIFALFLDMIVVERKKILRFIGHNLDHLFFLVGFLILITLISKGVII